jgi:hypothetical protein
VRGEREKCGAKKKESWKAGTGSPEGTSSVLIVLNYF